MKKILFLLGVIFFITGCSFKSYNKTIVYPNGQQYNNSYHSLSTDGVWCGVDGCGEYYDRCSYPYCYDGIYTPNEFCW